MAAVAKMDISFMHLHAPALAVPAAAEFVPCKYHDVGCAVLVCLAAALIISCRLSLSYCGCLSRFMKLPGDLMMHHLKEDAEEHAELLHRSLTVERAAKEQANEAMMSTPCDLALCSVRCLIVLPLNRGTKPMSQDVRRKCSGEHLDSGCYSC